MKNTHLVIVDDHNILLDGLISLFRETPSIEVAATFNLKDDRLMPFLQSHDVDVLMLDMHLSVKKGCEIAAQVKHLFPRIKILIHTLSSQADEINAALEIEVDGYILKKRGFEELVKAIEVVAHGGQYLDQIIMRKFIDTIGMTVGDPGKPCKGLTPTELRIVQYVCEEKNAKAILAEMGIVRITLHGHMTHIYRKLRVTSLMGIYKYAVKNNLFGESPSYT